MMGPIKIVDPSESIKRLQHLIVFELSVLLPDTEVHPIGAMAVPMAGKEELDFLVISENPDQDTTVLAAKGYRKGPCEKGVQYLKSDRNGFEIDVQIVPPGHHAIEYHNRMLEKLRGDEGLRNRYAAFKRSLDGLPAAEYKEKKSAWIRENLLD